MIEWEDRFKIGIDSIDKAHEEIFRVINRVHRMVVMGGNVEWTTAEAIKYLKTYTVNHFRDEEEYMRSINFRDYERHKAVHDGMRDRIMPRLHSRLVSMKYSDEAVEMFLRVCEKWLAKHIIGHDREIMRFIDEANLPG